MKNLNLLTTGSKPAPGNLVIVQGLVNTLNIETGTDEIGTEGLLRGWLVRHGLLKSNETVSAADLQAVLSLREALRSLLLANNGITISRSSIARLNRLFSQSHLAVSFKDDGTLTLSSGGDGMAGVFGEILTQVVQAMGDGTWSRLKACDEEKCRWAFYDGSRNHSGRWCSMKACGSRDKARAYRKRRATGDRKKD